MLGNETDHGWGTLVTLDTKVYTNENESYLPFEVTNFEEFD